MRETTGGPSQFESLNVDPVSEKYSMNEFLAQGYFNTLAEGRGIRAFLLDSPDLS